MTEERIRELLRLSELSKQEFINELEKQGLFSALSDIADLGNTAFRRRNDVLRLRNGRVHLRQGIMRILTYKGCKLCGRYEKATWKFTDYKIWRWLALANEQEWIVVTLIAKQLAQAKEG